MSDLTVIKNNQFLKPFFDRNSEFELKTFNFFDKSAVSALNWEGLEQEQISDRLKPIQRLLRLGVDAEEAMVLCESDRKLDSALAIASVSETAFVEAANFSDPEKAKAVHRRAREKTAGLMVVLANVIQFSSPRQATALFDNAQQIRSSLGDIPSYPELFGSLDYLQCEHCQSIFGPAAYFVDLMRMVEEYIVETDSNLSLKGRRPDLENILLTCDNTNDTVPYTQIVSEVLEAKLKEKLSVDDVFKHLATAKYPRNLPFNLYLEQIRIYIAHLETHLTDIYQTFHPQKPDSTPWAREYLGLYREEYDLIITEETDDLSDRYGVEGDQGDNFWGLKEKETFLKQTKLSWQELDDLLYQNLSSEEIKDSVANQFYINANSDYLNLSEDGNLENLNLEALDRIDRFLRLAKKLDWSFADLDWVLGSISSNGTKKIDETAIKKIAQIKRLQVQTKLPLDVLCSFWHDIKTIGKGDKPERPQDLFNRIFNNHFTILGQDPFDPANEVEWTIDGTENSNSLLRKRLVAALQLKDEEFIAVVRGIWSEDETIKLNLENLSRLFRNALVLKLIGSKVEEYKLLLKFHDQNLPNPDKLDIQELTDILELAQWLKASGFNVYELDYILYGTEYPSVEVFLPEKKMADSMKSLWQEVQLPPLPKVAFPLYLSDEQRNELNKKIASHFGIEPSLFSILAQLGADSVEAEDYILLLLTEVDTSRGCEWDKVVNCLKYISKMYLLVSKLTLTVTELTSITTHPQAYNIDSLTQLKVQNIQTLYKFKKQLVGGFGQPEENLLEYLASPSKIALAELTSWNEQEIQEVIGYLQDDNLHESVEGVLKLKQCFDLCFALGCRVYFLWSLWDLLENKTASEHWLTYKDKANSVTNLVKAKYSEEQWAEVFGKLNGALQERVCQILAEFTLWKLEIENSRQLSEYLLLDVEMTSCACNSKIQLGILSVQTYLQRCRMGIEPEVTKVNIPPVWWEWIMNYRLWEANRKVFLYPENYIDPSLRRDASPIFKELQDELLQSEITAATVEAAYRNYFDKLAELAKLQIVDGGIFKVQTPKSSEVETLFLLAKTQTQPHTFYYRTCERPSKEKTPWRYWEKIDLQINSEYVAPIYAFNRLFIFWVETKEITQSKGDGSGKKDKSVQATIKYSFQNSSQKWVAPQDLVKDLIIPSNGQVGDLTLDQKFWEQVYPYVLPELEPSPNGKQAPSPEKEITLLWGGLSSISSRLFNQNLSLSLVGLSAVTNIASDLLLVEHPLQQEETLELSEVLESLAVTTLGNLVTFTGKNEHRSVVDVFRCDSNGKIELVEHSAELSEHRHDLAVTTVGNLAIFAGGKIINGSHSNLVDIFLHDSHGNIERVDDHEATLSQPRHNLAATTVGNLAIFAGGISNNTANTVGIKNNVVDVFLYDKNGNIKNVVNDEITLSQPRHNLATTTIGNLAIFAGGKVNDDSFSNVVDMFLYDIYENIKKLENHGITLSKPRHNLATTTVGNLAIFAGGDGNDGFSNVVDVFLYDSNGNVKRVENHGITLSEPRSNLAATTVGNLAIFAGGDGNHGKSDVVDVFRCDSNGKIERLENHGITLSEPRSDLVATTVRNLAIFAGGIGNDGNHSKVVDVFSIPHPTVNTLPNTSSLPSSTTVTPIKNQPKGFILQQRSEFISALSDDRTLSNATRLTTSAIRHFNHTLFADGLDGLLSLESQEISEESAFGYLLDSGKLDFDGAYGAYFWEIFFHIPFLIASTLNTHQRYNEARKWYQYIFDPTIQGEDEDKERFWQFLPFRENTLANLEKILTHEAATQAYKDNPFDPHAIARLRIGAYEKAVVMRYIDNLLDWADSLFTQDTWESITQATTLYLLAHDLLGPKPENVGKFPTPKPKTFADIREHYGGAGSIPDFIIDLENYLSDDFLSQFGDNIPFNAIDAYFCVSENKEFAQYWERVEDRLFKIRHCQNIKGIERQLALFAPPIDPNQLVRLAAAGDGSLSLATTDTVPHYRFSHLLERAKGMTSTVIQLGANILNTLEKKDAEELAVLRATQEPILLQLITKTKEKQIEEAENNLTSLQKSLDAAKVRAQHYQNLIEAGLNACEIGNVALMGAALRPQLIATSLRGLAIPGYLSPSIVGTSNGGMKFGDAINQGAVISDGMAGILTHGASIASTIAQFQRRAEDWQFQQEMAQWDAEQIEAQIEAAKVRIDLAKAELEVHQKSIQQSQEIEQFFKDKFTNKDLYQWMLGRLSSLHFQTYKIALEMAYGAQKAYQYELNQDDIYIEPIHWDSNKKGLLAGESLMLELNQLEKAYLDGNERRLEVEKIVSLRQLDPHAFQDLIEKGTCQFSFDEKLFALDFPSHYCRQIKTISVSIPAVVSPYQNINATLTQNSNKVLIKVDGEAVKWLLLTTEDAQPDSGTLRQDWRQSQQIAISKGVNDSGMFVLNFQDERYLPFEGTGAISDWTLEMPKVTNRIDFDTITDVIITLSYTALQGGSTIYNAVKGNLTTFTGQQLFSLAQQFSSAWYQFMNPSSSAEEQTLSFQVSANMFPMNLKDYTVTQIDIQLVLAETADASDFDSEMKVKIEKDGSTILDDTINLPEKDGIVSGSLTQDVSDFLDSSWSLSMDKGTAGDPLRDANGFLDPKQVTNIGLVVTYEAGIDWAPM
ncbi:MAG: hypothetical protein F6J92_04990 [Symploca sp. SIO1A3]|nr:hypothetical protein [Symploca sp. SIO1A3]